MAVEEASAMSCPNGSVPARIYCVSVPFRPLGLSLTYPHHLHVLSKPWTAPWAKLTMSLTLGS